MNLKLTSHQGPWTKKMICSLDGCRKNFEPSETYPGVLEIKVDLTEKRDEAIVPKKSSIDQPWTLEFYTPCRYHSNLLIKDLRAKGFDEVRTVPMSEVEGWIQSDATIETRAKEIIGNRLQPFIIPPPETPHVRGEKG